MHRIRTCHVLTSSDFFSSSVPARSQNYSLQTGKILLWVAREVRLVLAIYEPVIGQEDGVDD